MGGAEGKSEERDWNSPPGTSLVVQWLRLHFTIEGVQVQSLVGELRSHKPLGQKAKTKQKQYYNKFNKYFKNSPYQKNLKISATQMRKQAAIFLPPDFTGRMKAKKKKSGKGPSTFQVPETVVDVFLFCFVSYSPILLFLCSFSLSLSDTWLSKIRYFKVSSKNMPQRN